MENKNIQPDTSAGYIIEKGEQVPAEFVVNAEGQVVSVASGGMRRRNGRSGVDAEGREKRFMLIRRLNSTGCAMLLDILLSNVVALQVVIVLIVVWAISGALDAAAMASAAADGDLGGLTRLVGFAIALTNAIAMPLAHTAAGYMHSVRNGFSLRPAMQKGKSIGGALPACIVTALGSVYAWSFVYMICAHFLPDSFFGRTGFGVNSFEGLSTAGIVIAAIYTVILAPLTEEFLFRGVLLRSLSKYGTGFAVVLSSLLFGLIHGNIYQAPFAFLAGIVLAYAAIRSGSIWRAVLVHFAVNLFSCLRDLAMLMVPAELSEAVDYGFMGFAGLMVLGSVVILCTCAKRISWKPVEENCTMLLPRAETAARLRWPYVLLSAALLAAMAIYVLAILASCGVTFGLENLQEILEQMAG